MTEDQKIVEMQERCKERAGNVEQPEVGTKHKLPSWDERSRAIPNHLTRSCLFAPIAKGRRKTHDNTVLASRSDVKITFSGKQLDEADRDVFLQALHEGRKVPLGEPVKINRSEFLKAIGKNNSGANYIWLEESFKRLNFAQLVIITPKYKLPGKPSRGKIKDYFHLIDRFRYDDEIGDFILKIDPDLLVMFRNHEYALIDWAKRFQIEKRVDLVKWLQCLIASNENGIQKYSLEDLKNWMDYQGRMRDFKKAILESISELERLKIISNGKIGLNTKKKDQASWTKL